MNRRQEDGYRTIETRTEERTAAFDTHFSLSFSDGLKKKQDPRPSARVAIDVS